MLHCPVVVAVVLQGAGSVTADLAYVGKRLPDGIQLVLLFRQQLSDLRKGSVLRVILLREDIFDIIKGQFRRRQQAGHGIPHFKHARFHFPCFARDFHRMLMDKFHHGVELIHVCSNKQNIGDHKNIQQIFPVQLFRHDFFSCTRHCREDT